ncbi:MAG: TRAP transporter small permease [Sphaerochaetaceae bacterium]|nr:TRAP transporter small permease [Sphaerochaetaceae bacterium]
MNKINKLEIFANKYIKFADVLYKIIQIIAMITFITMVISVSIAVVGRYIFNSAPSWTEEVGILCLIYLGFLTAALGIRDGRHIRMNIIDYIFPQKVCSVMHFCSYIVLLLLSVALVRIGWQSIELSWMAKLPATGLRLSFKYGIVFVAAICNIFMAFARLLGGKW